MKARHEFESEDDYKDYLIKYFSASALQGVCANPTHSILPYGKDIAKVAAECAQELLKQLYK